MSTSTITQAQADSVLDTLMTVNTQITMRLNVPITDDEHEDFVGYDEFPTFDFNLTNDMEYYHTSVAYIAAAMAANIDVPLDEVFNIIFSLNWENSIEGILVRVPAEL